MAVPIFSRPQPWLWYQSYKANLGGNGSVDGDGVCPVSISGVPGAEPVPLPGVFHTPGGGARHGAVGWYGDRRVVEMWEPSLVLD